MSSATATLSASTLQYKVTHTLHCNALNLVLILTYSSYCCSLFKHHTLSHILLTSYQLVLPKSMNSIFFPQIRLNNNVWNMLMSA